MKRKFVAAGAAVALVTGGAWMGLGSATATTAKPNIHGWSTSKASASATTAAVRADAASSAGARVLLIRAHQVSETDIDVNGDGFGPGDYFVFEEQLRYQHGPQVIGRDSVRCTVNATSFICDGTMVVFGKGKVVVYGASFGNSPTILAVTGGTGIYQGVGGQLKVADERHGNSLLAFEITR